MPNELGRIERHTRDHQPGELIYNRFGDLVGVWVLCHTCMRTYSQPPGSAWRTCPDCEARR